MGAVYCPSAINTDPSHPLQHSDDMFLYFYSDDIDPHTGELDDNIYRHISAPDIFAVYDSPHVQQARADAATNRSWAYYNTENQRAWCNRCVSFKEKYN